ncbi:unnamed protein product, partial [Hapterophycus canaliculatus]
DGGGGEDGAGGIRDTVLLHLWDEQTCLASLFRKGDGLAVYWPWLVQQQQQQPSGDFAGQSVAPPGGLVSQQQFASSQLPLPENSSGWHFEYGSATALFVLPRESREQLFSVARGNTHSLLETPAASGGGGYSRNDLSPGGGAAGERGRERERGGIGDMLHPRKMPADENGVRDLLQ